MIELDDQQQSARDWFEGLRDRVCAAFEAIEREAGSDAVFAFTPWDRTDASGEPGGGGVRGHMAGQVFEKVGVNVSTVGGAFSPEFAKSIPGADGEALLDISPELVRKRMETPFTDEDMERLLTFRGRYVEFNLLYDRGTLFGLKTGGNIDAILMSLPPLAKWA